MVSLIRRHRLLSGVRIAPADPAPLFLGPTNQDQYLKAWNHADFQFGAQDFTVAGWLMLKVPTPIGSNLNAVAKDRAATGYEIFSQGPASGKFAFGIRNHSPFLAYNIAPVVGTWYFVVGWHDQTNGQIGITVNDGAVATTARATAPSAGTSDFTVGNSDGGNAKWNGAIQGLGVWNQLLSGAVKTSLYNSGVGKHFADLTVAEKTGLVAWWDLNEVNGDRYELSGNTHTLLDWGSQDGDAYPIPSTTGHLTVSTPTLQTMNLVCDGDSMTRGYLTGGGGLSYPSQLFAKLGHAWRGTNEGVFGEHSDTMLANAPNIVDPLFGSQYTKNIVVCFIGINDMLGSVAVGTIESNIQTYCSGRRTAGFKVVVCTIPPTQYATRPAGYDAERTALNTWIVANWATFADALADVGANATLADPTNLTYYNGDFLHLTAAGNNVVCDVVKPQVLAL